MLILFAGMAIENMIVDALLAAEPYLKIAEQVEQPERYVYLTDYILNQVERSTEPVGCDFPII